MEAIQSESLPKLHYIFKKIKKIFKGVTLIEIYGAPAVYLTFSLKSSDSLNRSEKFSKIHRKAPVSESRF